MNHHIKYTVIAILLLAYVFADSPSCAFNTTPVCSGHGICSENECSCFMGFEGNECEIKSISDSCTSNSTVRCSGAGVCDSDNQCVCNASYFGLNCEERGINGDPVTATAEPPTATIANEKIASSASSLFFPTVLLFTLLAYIL